MKHIEKGEPLEVFLQFVATKPINWESMNGRLKHLCTEHILLEEQLMLGGYTEKPLCENANIHIDHFKKKGLNWPDAHFFCLET